MKKVLIFAVFAGVLCSCVGNKNSNTVQDKDSTCPEEEVKRVIPQLMPIDGVEPAPAALVDSASYLLGVNVGSMIKRWKAADRLDELNIAEFKKGIEDFLVSKGQPNPSDPEFSSQFKIDLVNMDRIVTEYLDQRSAYKNAVNKQKEDEFLASNARKANVDTTASGLQYTIEATGADYKVQPQDTVWVNYRGTLIDGTQFDAHDSTMFVANQVIKGWTEGLGLLGEGGKAKLYIPSKLGYGERDLPTIPAYSTLIFDVEVVKVSPYVAE